MHVATKNLFSSIEFYFWFLFPSLIALFALVKSLQFLWSYKSLTNAVFTILIFGTIAFSVYFLYEIFFHDAWPTFLPHLGIMLTSLLCFLQYRYNLNN